MDKATLKQFLDKELAAKAAERGLTAIPTQAHNKAKDNLLRAIKLRDTKRKNYE
jgi:cytidylate kinase